MGNNQSTTQNTNKKIKVFKIIRTEENSSWNWTRAYLNDYVNYSDGNYKHMDFKNDSGFSNALGITGLLLGKMDKHAMIVKGEYIGIDIDEVRRESSNNNFSRFQVKNIGMEIESGGKKIFMANGDEPESRKFIESLGELAEGIDNLRARQAYIQQAHYEHLQRERNLWLDLPPNGR